MDFLLFCDIILGTTIFSLPSGTHRAF